MVKELQAKITELEEHAELLEEIIRTHQAKTAFLRYHARNFTKQLNAIKEAKNVKTKQRRAS